MPVDPKTGRWFPPVSKRQAELLADQHFIIDVEGPRKSTKTVACLHKLVAHAWNTPKGRCGMVGRALTDNYDGGAWQDLVDIIIPQWIEGGFGMKWVERPKGTNLTHKMHCIITNKFGGQSTFTLESVKEETTAKVERVFKNRRFTCLYFTEASNFRLRSTFNTALECLRCAPDATPEEIAATNLLFLIDTNPAKEGRKHWIYKLFHIFRNMKPSEIEKEYGPDPTNIQANIEFQKMLNVQRFVVDDNIWMSPAEKIRHRAKFTHDPDEYNRHFLGLWAESAQGTIFSKVFKPERHVIGTERSFVNHHPQIMVPQDGCFELGTGWDVGGLNSAVVILEPVQVKIGKDIRPLFKALDEIVIIGTPTKVEDLVEEVLERMHYWEDMIGKKVIWKHWSDRSAFDRYENISNTYEAKEIYRASDGEIELMAAVAKESGSRAAVEQRIRLVQKLLHENRIYFSVMCENLIESISGLTYNSRGKLATGDKLKHAFDAFSYYVSQEAWSDIEDMMIKRTEGPSVQGVVSVRI